MHPLLSLGCFSIFCFTEQMLQVRVHDSPQLITQDDWLTHAHGQQNCFRGIIFNFLESRRLVVLTGFPFLDIFGSLIAVVLVNSCISLDSSWSVKGLIRLCFSLNFCCGRLL